MRLHKNVISCITFALLLVSNIYFPVLVHAQPLSDDERLKERLVAVHARYTASGDHDQFLFKLQQAKLNAQDPVVQEALEQIIVWREELRPLQKTSGISSIPVANTTQPTPNKKAEIPQQQEKNDLLLVTKQEQSAGSVQEVPITLVTNDRYQLREGYIDIGRLQSTRLSWVNELRASRGRQALQLHPLLHKTAADRSETMRAKGIADHKRFSTSAYYSYGELEQWFADRGIWFVNISRATFTENIGRSTFRCTQNDCTQSAIDAMRTTFDFYLGEEGTKNDAHRRTLIHPLFGIVGLGIAVDESGKRFYLTTHYGTQIK